MYGLIGADWGNLEISSNLNYNQNTAQSTGYIQGSQSSWKSGLMLGLGMEYLFIPCASIGLEYNYVCYRDLNFPNTLSTPILQNGVPVEGSFIADNNILKMKTNKGLIKLNYYFG